MRVTESAKAGVRHDEWLVDEALRDSFPASDPASSAQPGSIVNQRYARHAGEDPRTASAGGVRVDPLDEQATKRSL